MAIDSFFWKKASPSSKWFSEYVDYSFENAAGITLDERSEKISSVSEKDENNVCFLLETIFLRSLI